MLLSLLTFLKMKLQDLTVNGNYRYDACVPPSDPAGLFINYSIEYYLESNHIATDV